MRDTTIQLKREKFKEFCELIRQQFEEGAGKYSGNNEREATDFMTDYDPLYILVTMMKYLWRIRNGDKRASEDIIKIATYAYIWWLKNYA